MNLDINEVAEYAKWRRNINRTNLRDITFFEDGKEIEVTEAEIDEWRFTGMSNIDFVICNLLDESTP